MKTMSRDRWKRTTKTLPTLVLNVPEIANKSPEDVARILGTATSSNSEPGQNTTRNAYRRGEIEVTFKHDRAARITVRRTGDLPFDAAALQKLGLPPTKPTARTSGGALRWDRLCGPPARHQPSNFTLALIQ